MQQPEHDTPTSPGRDPAEGPPDMELPGADREDPGLERAPYAPDPTETPPTDREPPDDPNGDLPQRLGRRISEGANSGIASGEPDLVPDVEVPEHTM